MNKQVKDQTFLNSDGIKHNWNDQIRRMKDERYTSKIPKSSSSLAPQPSVGLGLLKIRLNFLEASQQFSFLQGKVANPTPNPHPGGPGLCIYIPQRHGDYPF
jgi:hypothetical protein